MKNALWRHLLRTSSNLRFSSYFVIYVYVTWQRAHQRFWRTDQKTKNEPRLTSWFWGKKWSDWKVKKSEVKLPKWISSDIKKIENELASFCIIFLHPMQAWEKFKMAITRFQSKEIQIFRNGILYVIMSHSLWVVDYGQSLSLKESIRIISKKNEEWEHRTNR